MVGSLSGGCKKTDGVLMVTGKGRIECVYEPAMTKAFLHGRTEAIRSVQLESVEFVKVRGF